MNAQRVSSGALAGAAAVAAIALLLFVALGDRSTPPALDPDRVLEIMQLDKKTTARGLSLILLEGIGNGVSIIIFGGIVSGVPQDMRSRQVRGCEHAAA